MTAQVSTSGLAPSPQGSGRGALVHPRVDAWVTGWLAVAIWLSIVVARRMGSTPSTTGWLLWTAAFVSATHFAMSYRLAYDSPRSSVRRHPVALAWAPAALAVVLGTLLVVESLGSELGGDLIHALTSLVLALTMWHYIKQAYGVIMIASRHTGFALNHRERLALRYGLYPLWAISTLSYLSGRQIAELADVEVRTDLLNGVAGPLRATLVITSAVTLAAAVFSAARRNRRRPPATIVAPTLAAVLWVGALPSAALAVVLLPALHALQYLACAGRAQHRLLDGEGRPPREQTWHLAQILVAAGCLGLLATSALPDALERFASPWDGEALWPVTLFVALNLHHYLIDATVWRSNGRLVRAVIGPLRRD